MKKIYLKKASEADSRKFAGYKIQYERHLNPAQHNAVMHNQGAALVIAGAGTGKTRTLVYRLARLIEDGVPAEAILLLTFTRKAAREMKRRASILLDGRCEKASGGTFHSFALQTLRQYADAIGYDQSFNVLDAGDSADTINLLRTQFTQGKPKRRFPKKDTLQKIYSLAVNRQQALEDLLMKDFPFFLDAYELIEKILREYEAYKKKYNVMDYDDLLVNLLELLKTKPAIKKKINRKFKYVMVDEYQDTNKLQREIIMQLAGERENVMAVGDDAQSIYAFRGAEFQNIIEFPDDFKECEVYKIEENYRGSQQILTLTNEIIKDAPFLYEKELFTRRIGEFDKPKIISCADERQQSRFIAQQILDLREQDINLEDIAVLFRSGFHSFDLEIELAKANIPYQKFGGMKFVETAHIKDMLSYFKALYNPKDAISWHRLLNLLDGVGPRTSAKIIDRLFESPNPMEGKINFGARGKAQKSLDKLLLFLKDLDTKSLSVGEKATLIAENYRPTLKNKYDDWQKRQKDIEVFISIAERYSSVNEFLNDMAIEPPIESVTDIEEESKEDELLNLSTIHSAKGLEWKAVFIIWALEGRFPSSKAAESLDALEEERRLFYVACTRAKNQLFISYPINVYDRESGAVLSKPSRFISNIDEDIAERYVLQEWDAEEN